MKPKPRTSQSRKRPKMLHVSEEMKQWSAMLEHEVLGWPKVSTRPMFGFLGVYRNNAIFAGLPRTRALGTPSSIIFRFDSIPRELSKRAQEDSRINFEERKPGARWFSFALNSHGDLRDALWWLEQAYRLAKSQPKSGAKLRAGRPWRLRK